VRVSRRGGWPATAPRAEHEAPPAGSPVGCRDTPFAGIGCAQAAARYYRHAAADSSVARNGGPTGMARSAGSAPGSGPGGGGDDRSAMSSCRQDRYRPGRRWRIDLAGLVGVHDRLACGGSRKPRVAVPRHRAYSSSLDRQPPGTLSQVLVHGRSGLAGSHRQTHELRDYCLTQLLRAGLTHVEHLPGVRAGELNVAVAVPAERQGRRHRRRQGDHDINRQIAALAAAAASRPGRTFGLGAMSSRDLAGINSEADGGPWSLERGRKGPNR